MKRSLTPDITIVIIAKILSIKCVYPKYAVLYKKFNFMENFFSNIWRFIYQNVQTQILIDFQNECWSP